MEKEQRINVEIAYAKPDAQVILTHQVAVGTTIEQAIRASGITERFPEIDLAANKVGIFGRLEKLSKVLREGDRIEIYRPLLADPKEVRRRRAAQGKVMRRGAGEANADEGGNLVADSE